MTRGGERRADAVDRRLQVARLLLAGEIVERRAERRGHQLAQRAAAVDATVVAPQQRRLLERRQDGLDVGQRGPGGQRRAELGERHVGAAADDELEQPILGERRAIDRGGDRRMLLGPLGELAEVGGPRPGEVGAAQQQRGDLIGGPLAELCGQRAVVWSRRHQLGRLAGQRARDSAVAPWQPIETRTYPSQVGAAGTLDARWGRRGGRPPSVSMRPTVWCSTPCGVVDPSGRRGGGGARRAGGVDVVEPGATAATQSNGWSGRAVMIARSMASDHSTHASTLSGCGWVSSATAVASRATDPRSPSAARATGPVRRGRRRRPTPPPPRRRGRSLPRRTCLVPVWLNPVPRPPCGRPRSRPCRGGARRGTCRASR